METFSEVEFAGLERMRRRYQAGEWRSPRDGCSLVERLGMKQPTVSKQLKVLRDAGLAKVRVDAKRRLYQLDTTPLREVDDWLTPYRKLWSDRLDALADHLTRTSD